MKPVVVLYSTRHGQTQRIAQYVVSRLRALGLDAELRIVTRKADAIDLGRYCGAILAASVHLGRHEREMVRFAQTKRAELAEMPAAFLTVSLSQAGAERPSETPEKRKRFAADVTAMVARFVEETGWQPQIVQPVAGALRYRAYNPMLRFVMKQIARRVGGHTDTSRNFEYTNWVMLDHFVDEWAAGVLRAEVLAGHAA